MMRLLAATVLLASLTGCPIGNAPPMYHSRADAFLSRQGVDPKIISRLIEQRPLSDHEIGLLARFDNVPTLHLLAAHPSTSQAVLLRLARHQNEEVRWGAASNPNVPLDILLQMRTRGQYSTMNEYLARNPALPEEVIHDMLRGKEAQLVSVAMNPACPPDLMREIAEHGQDLERIWLAWNRNIPPEIMAKLAHDPSPDVVRMLSGNPAYRKWAAARGKST